ncbi:MAG: proline hydroxylase [Alphaproteobacteria bacterium]|nr:proline hydroxylase [Alphaproteobacteria bacterium]|tara:strand:- start:2482 stop:3216 length:735 start_codon:yes stop_codon:yes gene_type:complete
MEGRCLPELSDISAHAVIPDVAAMEADLEAQGHVQLGALLPADACRVLAACYASEAGFRKRIVMARHRYGQGEYKYFSYSLPPLAQELCERLYPPLAEIANRWNERLGEAEWFPAQLADYLNLCHAARQVRPTPLMLRYGKGDHNRLHQDLYGDHVFPLQVTILLSRPGRDFSGGEFVLTEQRPRQQSRVEVVTLHLGDAVIFPVRDRPVEGTRGYYRATMRHGVSPARSGERTTLGTIFHDAA